MRPSSELALEFLLHIIPYFQLSGEGELNRSLWWMERIMGHPEIMNCQLESGPNVRKKQINCWWILPPLSEHNTSYCEHREAQNFWISEQKRISQWMTLKNTSWVIMRISRVYCKRLVCIEMLPALQRSLGGCLTLEEKNPLNYPSGHRPTYSMGFSSPRNYRIHFYTQTLITVGAEMVRNLIS